MSLNYFFAKQGVLITLKISSENGRQTTIALDKKGLISLKEAIEDFLKTIDQKSQ